MIATLPKLTSSQSIVTKIQSGFCVDSQIHMEL